MHSNPGGRDKYQVRGLRQVLAAVGGVISLLAVLMVAFAGGPHKRAKDETRKV